MQLVVDTLYYAHILKGGRKMQQINEDISLVMKQNPTQFLERKLTTLFGTNSMSIAALDLVKMEMCKEKNFTRQDGSDYYIHCVETTNTLLSFCVKDENVITAALLHDIVEDVKGYTIKTLEEMFNPRVAELVRLVTKEEGTNAKNPEKLRRYLENIKKSQDGSVIKTSDRMHNMMSLDQQSFEMRYKKALETEKFYLPFFKECRYLYPRYENLYYMARAQIEPLIFHIKSFYEELMRKDKEIMELEKKIGV